MATQPSIPACEIPRTEEPGGLLSMESQESTATPPAVSSILTSTAPQRPAPPAPEA